MGGAFEVAALTWATRKTVPWDATKSPSADPSKSLLQSDGYHRLLD
jgi:hypothetical protein